MIFTLLKVILLGIVEGITEWLPISSTGHMLLVDQFLPLGMNEDFEEMFFVVIQLGAILSVVVLFWNKLFPFSFRPKLTVKKDIMQMWLKVIVACIPAVVFGIFLDEFLEEHFGTPLTIAIMLIVYGIAFILVENANKKRQPKVNSIDGLPYTTAIWIGLFQVLALIPGTSRSGATIVGALLLGVSRVTAAEFTFFLAIPVMVGASGLKLMKFGLAFSGMELLVLAVGMIVSFVVSLVSIRFLMNYVRKHDFKVFGWYRILLGAVVILLVLFGILV